ncbi:MAG: S8 family serine peptidase [Sinomicrobium sp.]|nr:S8 family serine peptidase [Sinomicrobium sp.]
MKKYTILALVSFIYILGGCTYDAVSEEPMDAASEIAVEGVEAAGLAAKGRPVSNLGYRYTEIIIKYKDRISDREKAGIRKRHEVLSYKECNCADERLELWRFKTDKDVELISEDQAIIDIERRRAQAKADPGLEGTDFNFIVNVVEDINDKPDYRGIPRDKIVRRNTGVTVAVLDTGLDYNYEGFQRPFIYNSVASGTNGVYGGYMDRFGWDLVSQDNDPLDDNGHGTAITYFITSALEQQGIYDYQILPVKVADREGKASFFDLLCGFKYALNKPGVAVINLSLGWYGESSNFFAEFIAEALQKNILIVTSAGNGSSNNDKEPHYPSSYPDQNIISIAGMNKNMTALASYSNYGKESVDFAAVSENIPFNVDGITHLVSGTSFASAFATAHVAALRYEGILPGDVESYMASNAIYTRTLSGRIKTSSYIPYNSKIQ